MNVYKNIKEAKFQIEMLKNKIPFIKQQQQLDHHVQLINTLITLVNTVDMLAASQLKTDVVDKLILSRLRDDFAEVFVAEQKIPIHNIVTKIDADLTDNKELLKHQVIVLLQDIERFNIMKVIPIINNEEDHNFKIDKTKINKTFMDGVENSLRNATPTDEWEKMIEELLTEFKQTIQWN